MSHASSGTFPDKPCSDNSSCKSEFTTLPGVSTVPIFGFLPNSSSASELVSRGAASKKFCSSVVLIVTVWTAAVDGVRATEVTVSLMFHGPFDGTENSS